MSNPLVKFATSSIGRKQLVAVTGLMLFGFVVGHLSGNLLIFAGRDALNSYAEFLKSKPLLLWGARGGLLLALVLHLGGSLSLAVRNRAARPVGYRRYRSLASLFTSRQMVLSGAVILAFVIYHLLHFTAGVTNPDHYELTETTADATRHDVYGMVVAGFSVPGIVAVYIVAQLLLAVHLSHGIASSVQTFGLHHPVYTRVVQRLGIGAAVLIALGNCAIPIAVLAGWIGGAT